METPGASDVKAYPTCKICDRGALRPRKIRRLSGPAVAIGYVLLVPSVLGMACCAILLLIVVFAASLPVASPNNDASALLALASGSGAIIVLFVACFVSGLIGWLLVMKKDVLQCDNCGAIINAYATANRAEETIRAARRGERTRNAFIFFGAMTVVALILFVVSNYNSREHAAVTLPVTIVPTTFGLPDEEAPTYPASISVEASPRVQVAAYGGAGQVWLAPRSWTGHASEGVDGSTTVELYPVGEDGTSGPQISYTVIPACVGCMEGAAAPYFPEALKQWNEDYNKDGTNPARIPRNLKITRISPCLVTYALPNEHGLLVRGGAFYGPSDPTGDARYEGVSLMLPPADERLAEFLLRYFTDHAGQKCSSRPKNDDSGNINPAPTATTAPTEGPAQPTPDNAPTRPSFTEPVIGLSKNNLLDVSDVGWVAEPLSTRNQQRLGSGGAASLCALRKGCVA
jgi:hypothetical protein